VPAIGLRVTPGWAHGGTTDLTNLGPACQFHNRDRYRHPERYQRHRTGKDRWAAAAKPHLAEAGHSPAPRKVGWPHMERSRK
jgi:hypothetical protein